MKLLIFNIIIFFCSLYFGSHILYGPKSYFKYLEFCNIVKEKYSAYSELKANKAVLESKASLFSRDCLDIDALDEYARKVLDLASSKDIIIPIKKYSKFITNPL